MSYKENIKQFELLKKPDAIIFDWDNTLVDTWPLIHQAINNAMRFMDKDEWTIQDVKNNVHKSMRESFPLIFGSDWEKAGEIYKNSYRNIHLDQLSFLPGARDLISVMKKRKIPAFIVSNKIGSTLRKEAKKLNIDKEFFSLVGSMDSSFDKPNKEPVELALLGSNIDPKKHNVWFVGDTIADIDCAYNSGCKPIIYGCDNINSKTIESVIYEKGRNHEGPIALYFDHQQLIDKINQNS